MKRYCLENYLLDAEILTDLTRESEFSDNPMGTITQSIQVMKAVAMQQLEAVAGRDVFNQLQLEKICFDMKAIDNNPQNAAVEIWSRIEGFERKFSELKGQDFKAMYTSKFEMRLSELKVQWEDDWRNLCNGKLLLHDLRKSGYIKGDLLRLKRRIAGEMRTRSTESYNALTGVLNELLAPAS